VSFEKSGLAFLVFTVKDEFDLRGGKWNNQKGYKEALK
jgi:hypothetical protein